MVSQRVGADVSCFGTILVLTKLTKAVWVKRVFLVKNKPHQTFFSSLIGDFSLIYQLIPPSVFFF